MRWERNGRRPPSTHTLARGDERPVNPCGRRENGPEGVHTRLPRGARVTGRFSVAAVSPPFSPPRHLRAGFPRIDNLPGPCILPRRARMASEGFRPRPRGLVFTPGGAPSYPLGVPTRRGFSLPSRRTRLPSEGFRPRSRGLVSTPGGGPSTPGIAPAGTSPPLLDVRGWLLRAFSPGLTGLVSPWWERIVQPTGR
jgi:hypothetical protein